MVSWSCTAFGVRVGRPPGWPTVAPARPASHRGHVDPVLARLGQQALGDLILADHAGQRGPQP
jgi:hypothetical protein